MKALLYKLFLLSPLLVIHLCSNFLGFDIGHLEMYYAVALIFILGIPHGAMDHVIFKKERKEISHLFTILYWTLGLGNAVLWFYFPLEVTFFFIIVSAFHFGEAQFAKNENINKRTWFLTCWGMAVITLLLGKNVEVLAAYVQEYNNPVFYQNILYYLENKVIFYSFLVVTIVSMMYFLLSGQISKKSFLRESLFFILVLQVMNMANTLIGITTFFVFVHSLSVLEQEYNYLKAENEKFSLFDFVKVIFPFSLASYLMIGFFFALNIYGVVEISNAYLVIVILSSLTLPHAVVMNIFYQNHNARI